MSVKLSARVNEIAPSATLSVGRKAKELQARGVKILNLSVGEPDFPPDPAARRAALEAAGEQYAQYTDSRGIIPLREAICRRAEADLDLACLPGEVVASSGSKQSLYNLFQVLVDPGDEVLLPVPYWTSYPEMIKLAGGRPVPVYPGKDFKVRPTQLERGLSDRTRLLVLNSPSNPSGVVYDAEELKALAAWAVRRDITVISDDAYQFFVYDNQRFESIAGQPGMRERTVIVGAASKTYAMTGWRLGWFIGPEAVANAVAKLQDQSASNPCSLAQKAALAALEGDQESVRLMQEAFQRRRNRLMEIFSGVPAISYPHPAGAFYLFFSHPAIRDSVAFAADLLEQANVALVPGVAFGMEGYMRLSYAVADDVLAEAAGRLVERLR